MAKSRTGITLSLGYLHEWFFERAIAFGNRYASGSLDAEDIASEALLRLSAERFPDRPTRSRFHKGRLCRTDPAHVNRALWRACGMAARRERTRTRHRSLGETAAGDRAWLTPGAAPDPLTRLAIMEAVESLTARERAVVAAKAAGHRTLAEIARAAGCSRATACRDLAHVESRLFEMGLI